jgi:hypothetical protein
VGLFSIHCFAASPTISAIFNDPKNICHVGNGNFTINNGVGMVSISDPKQHASTYTYANINSSTYTFLPLDVPTTSYFTDGYIITSLTISTLDFCGQDSINKEAGTCFDISQEKINQNGETIVIVKPRIKKGSLNALVLDCTINNIQ